MIVPFFVGLDINTFVYAFFVFNFVFLGTNLFPTITGRFTLSCRVGVVRVVVVAVAISRRAS